MQDQHRNAIGLAALFDKNAVTIANIQQALIERFNRRVKMVARAILA